MNDILALALLSFILGLLLGLWYWIVNPRIVKKIEWVDHDFTQQHANEAYQAGYQRGRQEVLDNINVEVLQLPKVRAAKESDLPYRYTINKWR